MDTQELQIYENFHQVVKTFLELCLDLGWIKYLPQIQFSLPPTQAITHFRGRRCHKAGQMQSLTSSMLSMNFLQIGKIKRFNSNKKALENKMPNKIWLLESTQIYIIKILVQKSQKQCSIKALAYHKEELCRKDSISYNTGTFFKMTS